MIELIIDLKSVGRSLREEKKRRPKMKAEVIEQWWTTFLNIVALGIAVAILSACGGSGGGTTTSGTTPGLSSGEIEGFGSVVVNGVKYEVEGAEVETEHGVTTIIDNTTQEDH